MSGDIKELVELEVRELLESYGFPEDLPVVKGSARSALEELTPSEIGTGSVLNLCIKLIFIFSSLYVV